MLASVALEVVDVYCVLEVVLDTVMLQVPPAQVVNFVCIDRCILGRVFVLSDQYPCLECGCFC